MIPVHPCPAKLILASRRHNLASFHKLELHLHKLKIASPRQLPCSSVSLPRQTPLLFYLLLTFQHVIADKSKSKFAPKAKPRARNAASTTATPDTTSVDSAAATPIDATPAADTPAEAIPAPAPEPTLPTPQPSQFAAQAAQAAQPTPIATPVPQPESEDEIPLPAPRANAPPAFVDEDEIAIPTTGSYAPPALVDEDEIPIPMPTAGTEEEDEGVIAIPTGRSEAAIVSKPVAKPTAAAPVVIEEEGAAEESAAGEEGTATEGQDTETGKKAKAPKKPRAPRKPRAKKGEAAPPEGQAAATEATEDETTEAPKEKKPRKLRKPREPKPLDPDAPPVKRGRKRAVTPEDAETRTIDDNAVKMKDLVKDPGIGRTSKRGKQLASLDWNEVVKRQRAYKAELAARRAAGEKEDMKNTDERLSRLAEEASANRVAMAPQMRIVDGVITLDQESLRVDRHQRDAVDEEAMEVVEEDVHTRLVNSGTHSKKEKGDRWPAAETERFYEALSMFGTDFGIISKMFPGRSRRMVKNKFNCEERKNGPRVTQALKTRVRAGKFYRFCWV